MVVSFHPSKPLPADPLGQRLHAIFGRNEWDFIEAPTPAPDQKPQWRTVKDYPLRPRVLWQRWQDPTHLIGVRFTSETLYGLIDIDAGSPYCNPEAIAQLGAALETIGITRTLLLRSSHSNGLHLYLPLPEPVKTFDLAVALHECLIIQDFAIANGTLEVFPNPKPYGVEKIIHYNGHRLPLQPGTGSYVLDEGLNPISDRLDRFFWQWDGAAAHQDMDALRHALKIGRDNRRKKPQYKRRPNSSVDVWRHDLELEIEEGWSGPGQTNHLLKTIACYGHVFVGLEGEALITYTLETATHLPGYQRYCRHQQDIDRRIKAWCKAVEKYYWPLGDEPKRDTAIDQPPTPSVNQQRAEDARDRIAKAVETLKHLGNLPTTIRDLAQQLIETAHCGLKTLYKHLELWHPDHILSTTLERCVTVQPESDLALFEPVEPPQLAQALPPPDPPDPLSNELLHTQERFMKCGGVPSPSQKSPLERGVRGESLDSFPQLAKLEAVNPDEHYRSLPSPSSSASLEEQERYRNQESLRRCLFRLKWGHPQLAQFIAEQFEGRRFYQLMPDEVTLLVYRLQVGLVNSSPESL
ncbi:MAG: hypothetical protein AAFX78_09260 [Cyanobacteria bacterium J06638_20]